jgi:general secretion pathway protein D
MEAGNTDAALSQLSSSLAAHPGDHEVRAAWMRTRDAVINERVRKAEQALASAHYDEARTLLREALSLDPEFPLARSMLDGIDAARRRDERIAAAEALLAKGDAAQAESIARTVLAEYPHNARARDVMRRIDMLSASKLAQSGAMSGPFNKPVTIEFRDTPLRTVFEVLARTSGLNFVFDRDVRADTKVTVFLRNTRLEDVLNLILTTNGLDRKLLNENSVLVYPATPAKQKEHQELVTRVFQLANADAKQTQAMIRQVVKSRDVFVDERLNLVIVKDTPDAIRLAERLVAATDVPEPEVMLELEVLEVARSKLLLLGLETPDQIGYGQLVPPSSTVVGTGLQVATGVVDLNNRSGLTSYVSNPVATLHLHDEDGTTNVLANPRVRVKNRTKAKILIGDKLPVFTTTSTANVGVSAAVNYLDVGLKLDVEPVVSLDDDVSIGVALEVSSLEKQVLGPQGSIAYQIGTRMANTMLRLRNGETQILAGLISDDERSSATRIPGLGELPTVGRLFSSQQDQVTKTEIILLITPRIVRNLTRLEQSAPAWPSGTDQSVGARSLTIGRTAPGSLTVRGGAAPGRPEPAQTATAEPAPEPAREQAPEPTHEPVTQPAPGTVLPEPAPTLQPAPVYPVPDAAASAPAVETGKPAGATMPPGDQ